MSITINVEHNIEELKTDLNAFGSSARPMLLRILRSVANEYRKFVVNNYLDGQYLNKRSGLTAESVIAYKNSRLGDAVYTIGNKMQNRGAFYVKLANIYEHDGDIKIAAKNKKVIRFTGQDGEWVYAKFAILKPRPFMTDSSNTFPFEGKIESTAGTVITKQLKKNFE